MLQPLIPSAEQQQVIDNALSSKADGAFMDGSEVGTGKTSTALKIAKARGAEVILIIGPLQTLGSPLTEDSDYAEGWWGESEQEQMNLPFRQIDSSKAGKAALADYKWRVPGIYFVGHAMFVQLGWKTKLLVDRNGKPKLDKHGKQQTKKERTRTWAVVPDVAIFDEIHAAQNVDSWTHKTLMQVDAGFKIGASGTPTGNNFDGAYAVTKWLWPHRAEKNIYEWRAKWAEVEYDHFAVRNQKTVGEKNPGEFFNQLPCYAKIESDLSIEIDDQTVYIDLSPEQKRIYAELDAQNVAWIKDHPMVVNFPTTRRVRQRQASLGVPTLTRVFNEKTQEFETEVGFDLECESPSIDRMWSILDDDFESETALIFTDSEIFAEVLTHRINKHYGEGSARKWSGKVPRATRNQNKADFIAGEYKYFVATISSVGTGTNGIQRVCRNTLYVSPDDSRIDNQQGDGRTARRGTAFDLVRYRRMVRRGTWDEGIMSNHMREALANNKRTKKRR